ncbi:hypothetical protein ACSS6W_000824 [Trichoderma asperelloides]
MHMRILDCLQLHPPFLSPFMLRRAEISAHQTNSIVVCSCSLAGKYKGTTENILQMCIANRKFHRERERRHGRSAANHFNDHDLTLSLSIIPMRKPVQTPILPSKSGI